VAPTEVAGGADVIEQGYAKATKDGKKENQKVVRLVVGAEGLEIQEAPTGAGPLDPTTDNVPEVGVSL
jgi:hypothetical protein